MLEPVEYKGEWFIPDISKINLYGTLKIKPFEQATLELICSNSNITQFFNSNRIGIPIRVETILGTCFSKKITLVSCYGFWDFSKNLIEFEIDIVLFGVHFPKKSDILFNEINVHFEYLSEWINIYGFNIKNNPNNQKINITFKQPKPILLFRDKEYGIYIDFKHSEPTTSNIQRELNIKQDSFLRIKSKTKTHLDNFQKIINLFQQFLVMAVVEPTYPLSISANIEHNVEQIDIFYQTHPHEMKKIQPSDMLFTYPDISRNIKHYMKTFFDKYNKLEAVYDIYLGIIYASKMYMEHQFLSLITAIEAFHRRMFEGEYISKKEYLEGIYRDLVNAIPEGIDENYTISLKERMKFLFEYSLRKRLTDILNNIPIHRINYLMQDNNKEFVNDIINNRNYLVHYDKSIGNKIDFKKLYKINRKLKAIIHLLLLKEIGVDLEKVDLIKFIR